MTLAGWFPMWGRGGLVDEKLSDFLGIFDRKAGGHGDILDAKAILLNLGGWQPAAGQSMESVGQGIDITYPLRSHPVPSGPIRSPPVPSLEYDKHPSGVPCQASYLGASCKFPAVCVYFAVLTVAA